MSDEELERLRRRRLLELQKRLAEEQQRAREQQEIESSIQAALRRILTPSARQRLTNLKMVRPEFTRQLEIQLIQLAQQGRIPIPMGDKELKELLRRIHQSRREIKIRRI
ncbi:DNA-binding protein [Candidatus Bathyarchaeota archaeon]|nr:DNA-binding protein [Candidatus Bathyarchaeota archaeon]